jgi:hypothetical protein
VGADARLHEAVRQFEHILGIPNVASSVACLFDRAIPESYCPRSRRRYPSKPGFAGLESAYIRQALESDLPVAAEGYMLAADTTFSLRYALFAPV